MSATSSGAGVQGRDRFLDVVRSFAMAAVVFNHFVYSFYYWDPNGGVARKIQNMGQAWVTWPFIWELSAFFFVGGAVIHSSALKMPYRQFVAKRVWRLSLPVVFALCSGLGLELLANAAKVPNCRPGNGPLAGIVPMQLTCPTEMWVAPLWFMMVFLPLSIISPFLARLYRGRYRWLMIAGIVALVGLSDLRFFGGHPALLTSELCWLVPWLLGFSYADGGLTRIPKQRLLTFGIVALVVTIVGIALGPWTSVLGSYPRTLETVMEALVSIPILVGLRDGVARLGNSGPGAWIVRAIGPRMMSVYVWHEPAQGIVIAAAAALHLHLARELGWRWAIEKVPFVAAFLLVFWLLLKVVEPIERIPPPSWMLGRPAKPTEAAL